MESNSKFQTFLSGKRGVVSFISDDVLIAIKDVGKGFDCSQPSRHSISGCLEEIVASQLAFRFFPPVILCKQDRHVPFELAGQGIHVYIGVGLYLMQDIFQYMELLRRIHPLQRNNGGFLLTILLLGQNQERLRGVESIFECLEGCIGRTCPRGQGPCIRMGRISRPPAISPPASPACGTSCRAFPWDSPCKAHAIEPFEASQDRRAGCGEPLESVEPGPDVHRATAVPLRLVAEAFYLAGRLLGRLPRVPRVGPVAPPARQGGIGAAVPLPPPPEAGPLGLVAGEGLPYAPARFRGPPHRTEPRLQIVGQEIPRPFAYNAHGISFHAFLVENIIRRDAFSFAPARTPYGVWDGGRLSASDFVSHHLK